jgi:hypothetical protein
MLFGSLSKPSTSFVPLTYRQITMRYDPTAIVGNTLISETHSTYAVRADGSTAEITNVPHRGGTFRELRRIVDLQKGRSVTVDDLTMSMISSPNSDQAGMPLSCSGVMAEFTMFGYQLIRTTVQTDGLKSESYRAPALGCVTLLARTYTAPDGANNRFQLTREDRVENIILGEPDNVLFSVGPDYVERSPAEFVISMAGDEVDEGLLRSDAFIRKAEDNYRLHSPAIVR